MSLTFIFLSKQETEMIAEFLKYNQMILEFRTLWGDFLCIKFLLQYMTLYLFTQFTKRTVTRVVCPSRTE